MTTPKTANRFMLCLLLWAIPASLILIAISNAFPMSTGAFVALSQVLIFGLPCILILIINRKRVKDILPMKKLGAKNFLLIVAMSLLAQPLMMLISTAAYQVLPSVAVETIEGIAMDSNFLIALLFIAVVPSIFEELAFRGVIFAGYKEIPIFKAALINGLMFGMMHMDAHQFVHTAIYGFILCFFVYYTKSIWSAVLSHFVLNSTQVSFLIWQQNQAPAEEYSTALALVILGVIALVTTVVFVFIYNKFKLHNMSNIAVAEDDNDSIEPVPPAETPKRRLVTPALCVTVGIFLLMIALVHSV